MVRQWSRIASLTLVALTVALYIILSSGEFPWLLPRPVVAQVFQVQEAATWVYQQLPELPKENQYVRRENGKVATDSTLLERLIQYHVNVKGRSPLSRLDWKITLADYLGVNGYLQPASYPGRSFLRTNPLEGDRAVIQRLNRTQRDSLVQTLVNFYAETTQPAVQSPAASPAPTSSKGDGSKGDGSLVAPSPTDRPQLQPLPRPGAAQLLLPGTDAEPATRPTGGAQLLLP